MQCTATDTAQNVATGSFNVMVANAYTGFLGPLSPYQPPPKSYNGGSSTPIVWKWTFGGVPIDSGDSSPRITFKRLQNAGLTCESASATEDPTFQPFVNEATPGNTFFQDFSDTNPHSTQGPFTWQFNWNSPAGAACYNLYIESLKTSQVRGPFRILIK